MLRAKKHAGREKQRRARAVIWTFIILTEIIPQESASSAERFGTGPYRLIVSARPHVSQLYALAVATVWHNDTS